MSRTTRTVLLLLGLAMITMAGAMDAAERHAAAGTPAQHAETVR